MESPLKIIQPSVFDSLSALRDQIYGLSHSSHGKYDLWFPDNGAKMLSLKIWMGCDN